MLRFTPGTWLALSGGFLACVACFMPFYSVPFLGSTTLLELATQNSGQDTSLYLFGLFAAFLMFASALLSAFTYKFIQYLPFLAGAFGLIVVILLYLDASSFQAAGALSVGYWFAALGYLLGASGAIFNLR